MKQDFKKVRIILVVAALAGITGSACTTPKKVYVKKGSCVEVFAGAMLECEVLEKADKK